MPIYEYECAACGYRMEKLQKVSDPRLTTCPQCNEEALAKLISAAAFRLKGSGWYETDFKTGKKRNLIGDPLPSSGDTASGSTAATESAGTTKESTSDKGAGKSAEGSSANSSKGADD